MATSVSMKSIHKSLLESHLFGLTVHLTAPDKHQRAAILKSLVKKNLPSLNENLFASFDSLCAKLEGYTTSDLVSYYQSSVNTGITRRISGSEEFEILTKEDFESTIETFKPDAFNRIKKIEKIPEWAQIGGLKKAKATLIQTFGWPTLYPQLFANSPLRLPSGLLLFGYPGTIFV